MPGWEDTGKTERETDEQRCKFCREERQIEKKNVSGVATWKKSIEIRTSGQGRRKEWCEPLIAVGNG